MHILPAICICVFFSIKLTVQKLFTLQKYNVVHVDYVHIKICEDIFLKCFPIIVLPPSTHARNFIYVVKGF